jgi:CxxC motif-containing protein
MKEITCIVCPKGCTLTVDGANGKVTGNSCDRGKDYGLAEVTNPTRVLTTTVAIDCATASRLPVKTSAPIPKGKLLEAMAVIETIRVTSPVQIGDVIYPNLLDTGADLIACSRM